jgi:uncharacterized protein (TIGR02453 family)
MAFHGWKVEALEFFEGLEADNSKAYWQRHKDVYDTIVRAPMEELLTELEPTFGEGKIFRPYRDVRFAKDKTPYKTNQGAYVAVAPATGWYVEVSAPGVRVGSGFYHAEGPDLARIRDAIADERTGTEVAKLLKSLQRKGFELGGDRLKTTPRGYDADHPRIDLLRHKSMTLGKSYGFEPVIHTPELLDLVRKDWRALRPFVDWVTQRLT